MLQWYIDIINFLDQKALSDNPILTPEEIEYLDGDQMGFSDSAEELIADIADANNCGCCFSWQDLVNALRHQFATGERVKIVK